MLLFRVLQTHLHPFRTVSGPKIPVPSKTLMGYCTYRFLVDTGADFTLTIDLSQRKIPPHRDPLDNGRERPARALPQGGISALS